MPKRTNFFQQLVRAIYEHTPGGDVRVIEPALLTEPSSGAEREVDILLETTTKGIPIRIAVECRDRSRRDDLQWIDALIGKYVDLPVDKVIAVSRNGFTRPAVKKAAKHGIQAIAFERVKEIDWSGEFIKLGLMIVDTTTHLTGLNIKTEPPLPRKADMNTIVASDQYGELGTIRDIFEPMYQEEILPRIRKEVQKRFFDLYAVVADLDKLLYAECSMPVTGPVYLQMDDCEYRIKQITFKTLSSNRREDRPVEHFIFQDALITYATLDDEQPAPPVVTIQMREPGEPKAVRLFTTGTTRPAVPEPASTQDSRSASPNHS